ncbi:class Ib ribonucleoside-diphosphate reductase assembly flavoprotein NrdI [Mammaliicoccus lentus]|uniref:class Ib ribonucleoside-diphosphate reductase assembly flavoprotein NrdI n=1 Tax=Mammaliicoccus lentus TaxID=42858 RepID=UPI0010727D70|nr:class Ib ribonucleoside-diphosphate reductase assembly flavoprotein NrdI [Mammaliicoccus lentus]MBF0793290.1 class Ib ribonucleoside-diphosphate reductase assembly flavoprotein NrdI [Mammaliicoccus lentus]TFV17798.1 class Ib ribonucleoside-diphosphate reductase assembly flavoprotein NrdI [Mammaliicoccus lentus]
MDQELITQNKDSLTIVYYTKTKQTEKFVSKLLEAIDIQSIKIQEELIVDTPFILLTPTYFFGEVPKEVTEFLHHNHNNLVAVMSSGNRNWGGNFAKSGETISKEYNVELIGKYELAGNNQDIERLVSYINNWR